MANMALATVHHPVVRFASSQPLDVCTARSSNVHMAAALWHSLMWCMQHCACDSLRIFIGCRGAWACVASATLLPSFLAVSVPTETSLLPLLPVVYVINAYLLTVPAEWDWEYSTQHRRLGTWVLVMRMLWRTKCHIRLLGNSPHYGNNLWNNPSFYGGIWILLCRRRLVL